LGDGIGDVEGERIEVVNEENAWFSLPLKRLFQRSNFSGV